jgi:hypothetical protein
MRCYWLSALAACTVAALLTLRDRVIAPRLSLPTSAVHGWVEKPKGWTSIDRDYE